MRDLIDTLWNVKKCSKLRFTTTSGDLIDTLWNVKYNYLLVTTDTGEI